MRFYLKGQRTFGIRGCEAIVRSTVGVLRKEFGDIEPFLGNLVWVLLFAASLSRVNNQVRAY